MIAFVEGRVIIVFFTTSYIQMIQLYYFCKVKGNIVYSIRFSSLTCMLINPLDVVWVIWIEWACCTLVPLYQRSIGDTMFRTRRNCCDSTERNHIASRRGK